MLRSICFTFLALGWLQPASYFVQAQKVAQMPLKKRTVNTTVSLGERDPFAISMENYIPGAEYWVTALIGTPPQEIDFVLDTGSSDIWMFGPHSCEKNTSPCEGGEFDVHASRTGHYMYNGRGAFDISYVSQGSSVSGDYFYDTFEVGAASVTSLVMAVATAAANVPSGIMGIGLAVNEAAVNQGLGTYANFPDLLVKQGIISYRAYSLYLDDIGASNGKMIFGGYDTEKFRGELTMLPIQTDEFGGQRRSSFIVSWTSLGIIDSQGDFTVVEDGGFLYPATLDSGTTLTSVPSSIFKGLVNFFELVEHGPGQAAQIDCNFGKDNPGQLIYGFGGKDGPQIAVEFDELVIPLYKTSGEEAMHQGQPVCAFGIIEAGDRPILFGQTFLRSAYVLYDLDNRQVGLAQTVFNSTDANVVEYNGTPAQRISEISGAQVTVNTAHGGHGGSGGSGKASTVTTHYTISTAAYPSESPATSFPSTIPAGPTGRVPFSGGNDQGYAASGDSGRADSNGERNNGDRNDRVGNNGGGSEGGQNSATGLPQAALASWTVCLALLLCFLVLL